VSESTDQVPQLQAKWRPYPAYKDPGVEWLGEIPEHWAALPLKRVASRMQAGSTPPTAELRYYEEGEVPWFTPESFDMDIAITRPAKLIARSAVKEGAARLFEAGSVMLVTIASIGKVGVIEQPASCNQQIMSISFRPDEVSPRFAAYQIKPLEAALQGIAPSSTVAILGQDEVGYLPFALPPVGEQRAIADFLDRETAKIDPLVEKNQRLIELLVEKRTALITQAVTKGLDPTVPMKDSGIEWLGKIPEHWDVLALKRIARRIQAGSTPSTKETAYYSAGEIPWYTPGDFGTGVELAEASKLISRYALEDGKARLFGSQSVLLVAIGASTGKSGILTAAGSSNQQITCVTVTEQRLIPRFAAYHMKQLEETINSIAPRTTLPIMNATRVGYLPFLIPAKNEQQPICDQLDRQSEELDGQIGLATEGLRRLREYRTALISAAVTGKIDVRGETE